VRFLKLVLFGLIVILGVSSYAKAAPLSQVPSILYVMEGETGDCLNSWATACELQTAIFSANPGDQIWVAAGTYKPTTSDPDPRKATFQLEAGVAIYGGFPADGGGWETRDWVDNITTLSGDIGVVGSIADNSYHVVTGSGVGINAVLDGFTISAGNTEDSGDGGGMYNSDTSLTLTNITFSGNTASNAGGGMYNANNSSPTLTNVTFSGNSATNSGGGMYNSDSSPTLTNVTFSGNSATNSGGGMVNYNKSNSKLTNVTFSNNSATDGGGMFNESSSNPTLINVTFSENSATSGGGMRNGASSPALTNVTFSNNTASSFGGGMANWSSSSPTLTNVTFTENSATVYGGGMWNFSTSPTLTNAILWGNSPDQIYGSSATVTYSDIQGVGVHPGTGNINADPLLGILTNNGGFTQTHALRSGSKAIDTANPAFCLTYDQRFYTRPIDGDGNGSKICDMGAYEYRSSVDGFTLTVEKVGSGSVIKNPVQLGYRYGEVVTLTANPGWTFTGWSGGATGTENPLTKTIDRITKITANFTQDDYSLTTTVNP